jgi:hypothetical protein
VVVRKANNMYEVEFVVLTPFDTKIRVLWDMAPVVWMAEFFPSALMDAVLLSTHENRSNYKVYAYIVKHNYI